MTSATSLGLIGDGETDNTPLLQAAMADAAISSIEFEPGHYRYDSQVELRSGLAIRGFGSLTRFSPLPTFAPRAHLLNGMISTEPDSQGITVSDLTLEGLTIGAGASNTRIHGLVMRRTIGFLVERVVSMDWSGYAFWANGFEATGPDDRYCNGNYDACRAENSNVLFEQSRCRGVTLRRCHASDGKGTIGNTEAAFHPWQGAEQVLYEDCSYAGSAGSGIAVLGAGELPIKEFTFRRVRVQMQEGATALIAGWQSEADKAYRIELTIEDSDLSSALGYCANLLNVDGTFRRTRMTGYNVCVGLGDSADILFEDTDLLAFNDPAGSAVAHALRLEAGSSATVTRGSLRAQGESPTPYIRNDAATLNLSSQTILEPA